MKIVTRNNIDALKTAIENLNKSELLGQKLATLSAVHTLSHVIQKKQTHAEMEISIENLKQQLEIIDKQLLKFN